MKTYKTANEVKEALLSCETVKIKGWTARINDRDEVEVCAPNGAKVANDLQYLSAVVAEFMKEAGGIPDKMPAPVKYDSIPAGSGPLGDDTSGDKPWKDPKVNTQPVPQGTKPDSGLGKDTSGDKPWVDPKVNKSPEKQDGVSMSDPTIGPDTSKDFPNWGAERDPGAKAAQTKVQDSSVPSEDSEDGDPFFDKEFSDGTEVQGELPSIAEFHSAKIVDTFSEPERAPTFKELRNASPSASLLRDIADPDKWAARQTLMAMEELGDDVAAADLDGEMDLDKDPEEEEDTSISATRIRESWGQDGAYSRDMDAETAEDLYHLTRSLGQEGDYDWATSRAVSTGQDVPPPPAGIAETPVDTGVGSMSDSKLAVDESAKSYWINYYNDYGKQLVKDPEKKIDKKDPEKKKDVAADRSVDDKYEPKVQEAPKPAGQQKVKAQMQSAPGGAIPAPPGAAPAAPSAPSPAPEAGPPAGPEAGPKPEPNPGAGDAGLKSLGWTDQDIQAMSDEDKNKIMQVKLRKPGAGVSETGVPPKAPIKPPIDPTSPGAPEAAPPGPDAGPTPMPVPDSKPAPVTAMDKAFEMLTREAQVPQPAAPAPAPAAPAADPAAPAAPQAGGEFAGQEEMATDMSPESSALSVYNEIMEQEVKASTADQVPALKAQMLVQRLLTEVGMPINEARTLFGLTKDKGFNTLFK